MRRVVVASAVAIASALVWPTFSSLDTESSSEAFSNSLVAVTMDVVAVECPAGFDNGHGDGACLAFDGQIPGPSIVVEAFTSTRVTIRNRVAETIDALNVSQATKDSLREARVSWHRHGAHVAAGMDGVDAAPGTLVVDSAVGSGETFTYESEHRYVGGWHYHDHVMFTGAAHGMARGLFGSLVVVPPGQAPDHVFDLHFLDAGPNGGLGMNGAAMPGQDFIVNLVGLGDRWWTVRLENPDGSLRSEEQVGPGTSVALRVNDAAAGVYEWEATPPFRPGTTFRGQVTVA